MEFALFSTYLFPNSIPNSQQSYHLFSSLEPVAHQIVIWEFPFLSGKFFGSISELNILFTGSIQLGLGLGQFYFIALKNPLCSIPPVPRESLGVTDLFPVSRILPSLEFCLLQNVIQLELDWLLSLNSMHLSFLHVFLWFNGFSFYC